VAQDPAVVSDLTTTPNPARVRVPPSTFPEYLEARANFTEAWEREMEKEKDRHARASVSVALRAVEERPYLMIERDRAVKHAKLSVYYVWRLRAKLERAEALIRELRAELRARVPEATS
jgi:hypothetical protein